MVEILDSTTDTCVVAHLGGRVKGEEYRVFLDAVDERLKVNDRVNIVTDLSGFEGYGDLEAFKEDCHFGTHEFRHVGRCALVGDPKWVEAFFKVAMLFYKAEEKSFPSGELDAAIAWACE